VRNNSHIAVLPYGIKAGFEKANIFWWHIFISRIFVFPLLNQNQLP
jgi:hypothetical protein